jgi:hypothetical protein
MSPVWVQLKLSATGWVHRRAGRQLPHRAEHGVIISEILSGIRHKHGKPPVRKAAADADVVRDVLPPFRATASAMPATGR